MECDPIVVLSEDPRIPGLEASGWRVSARSWAAALEADDVDRPRLQALVDRACVEGFTIRPLEVADGNSTPRERASRFSWSYIL